MSLSRVCDRCGKVIQEYTRYFVNEQQYDFCIPECNNLFFEFIKEVKR